MRRLARPAAAAALGVLLAAGLGGCGQKGPLVRPGSAEAAGAGAPAPAPSRPGSDNEAEDGADTDGNARDGG